MMPKIWLLLFLIFFISPVSAADKAPPFVIKDDHGQEISFPREQQGVDIYFFWASWCPYCKALMPHLQSMLEEYGDQVQVYAFNIRDDEDPVAYLGKYGFDFHLIPQADELMSLYGVKGTPGVFLVDGDGNVHLNLYELPEAPPGNESESDLKHFQRAARKAPWWAAQIRQSIDAMLE